MSLKENKKGKISVEKLSPLDWSVGMLIENFLINDYCWKAQSTVSCAVPGKWSRDAKNKGRFENQWKQISK